MWTAAVRDSLDRLSNINSSVYVCIFTRKRRVVYFYRVVAQAEFDTILRYFRTFGQIIRQCYIVMDFRGTTIFFFFHSKKINQPFNRVVP